MSELACPSCGGETETLIVQDYDTLTETLQAECIERWWEAGDEPSCTWSGVKRRPLG